MNKKEKEIAKEAIEHLEKAESITKKMKEEVKTA